MVAEKARAAVVGVAILALAACSGMDEQAVSSLRALRIQVIVNDGYLLRSEEGWSVRFAGVPLSARQDYRFGSHIVPATVLDLGAEFDSRAYLLRVYDARALQAAERQELRALAERRVGETGRAGEARVAHERDVVVHDVVVSELAGNPHHRAILRTFVLGGFVFEAVVIADRESGAPSDAGNFFASIRLRADTSSAPRVVDTSPRAAALRALDFAREDCMGPNATALGRALLAAGPARMRENASESGGPPRCTVRVPRGASSPPGASFADVDGDGVEEALVVLEYQRQGRSGVVRRRAVAVLRASDDSDVPVTPVLVVFDDAEVADGALTLEDVEGIRVEGRHAIVTARAGCYECGCDSVEVVFDCSSTPCRELTHRVTEPVAACDSP